MTIKTFDVTGKNAAGDTISGIMTVTIVDPAPDPVPEPTPDPVPVPSKFPDATSTGVPVGTALTKSGSVTLRTAGSVLQNKDITGNVVVLAKNCVIKNCRINAGGNSWGIDSDGFNTNVIDCEIFSNGGGNAAILGQGGTYQRLNIHGFENGIVTQGNNQVLYCYIHNLGPQSGGAGAAHIDGVSIQAGSNTVVRHNHIESWDTSCVFIKNDFTSISNITVDGNRLINQPGKQTAYAVYSSATGGHGSISGVSFTNNIMQRGNGGFASIDNNTVTWLNNTDYVTGAQIPHP